MNPRGLKVSIRQATPIPLEVDFFCAPGEVLALVGPSGSGKTTVLRCIAGLHNPQSGFIGCCENVWLDSENEVKRPPQQRRVGLVFQAYGLFPHLSARRNVMIALGHHPANRRGTIADELIARVHLNGLSDRLPSNLSGGQQQRVALARALARDPGALLLDEPFSAVDQVTRRKLRLELAALTRELDIPIILVTHDLDEAAMLAHRLCVMHAGRTLQTGPPAVVMEKPASAEIARLMDVRNIFSGHIIEHQPKAKLTIMEWRGLRLELPLREEFAVGANVHWTIPPGGVQLHQRVRPSKGEQENPVSGTIDELLTLGGLSTLILSLEGPERTKLTLELPPHVVKRNALKLGQTISASLVGSAFHIMAR